MAEPEHSWIALDRAMLIAGLFGWIMLFADKIAHWFGYQIDNLDVIGAAVGLGFLGLSLVRSVLARAPRERIWEADRSLLWAYVRLVTGLAMLVALTGLGGYYAVERWRL